MRASDAPDDSGEHRPGTERDRFAMALPLISVRFGTTELAIS